MSTGENKKNKYYGEKQAEKKSKREYTHNEVSYYRDAKRKRRESEALFR